MKAAGLLILWVFTAGDAFGQVPAATQSKFEVASVKPSAPNAPGMFIRPLAGGGLQVSGASLKNLISLAYGVRSFQISAESQWVDTELFDIDARTTTVEAAASANPADDRRKIFEGLKSLLADRFHLVLHSETREQPVYSLVVNRGGPKLQGSNEPRGLIRKLGRDTIKGQAVEIGMLALNLSNELGRRVVDKTGLTGKYDFELKWEPAQVSAAQLRSTQTAEVAVPVDVDAGPSIFTALQEQLGLRLESGKGPVEVLVIDRAERPSKN